MITAKIFEDNPITIEKAIIAIKPPYSNTITSLRTFFSKLIASLGATVLKKFKIGNIKVFFPSHAYTDIKSNISGNIPITNIYAISAAIPGKSSDMIRLIRFSMYIFNVSLFI